MATPTNYVYKCLASGQLLSSKATLYTVPASTTTPVKSISVVNTGMGNNVVYLYVNPAGTSRSIFGGTLASGDQLYMNDVHALESGDLIEGYATNAAQCDYVISGAEAS